MDDRFQTAEEFKQSLLEAGEISKLPIGHVHIQPPPPVSPPSKDQDGVSINGRSPEIVSDPLLRPVQSNTDRRVKARWLTIFLVIYIVSLGAAFFLIPGLSSGLPSFRLPAVIGQFLSPTNIPTQSNSATRRKYACGRCSARNCQTFAITDCQYFAILDPIAYTVANDHTQLYPRSYQYTQAHGNGFWRRQQ